MSRLLLAVVVSLAVGACTSVELTTVDSKEVASSTGEAVAVIQADALGFTAIFHIVDIVQSDLDMVTNKMLVQEAKAMGATRVELKDAYTTPRHGIFALSGIFFGFPYSHAVGVAVK